MNESLPKTMTEKRFVAKYFAAIEELLAARADVPGSAHRNDKGEDREQFLMEFFNDHLPRITNTHRGGAILDSEDSLSNQTDIVIYSNLSPLLQQKGKPIFFSEGTYAAIEVKSLLTTDNLRQSLEKATKIKKIRKFRLPLQAYGILSHSNPKAISTICTGIFAYKSRIKSIKTIRKILLDYHKTGVPNTEMIDFVSVNGSFCVYRHRTEDIEDNAGFFSSTGKSLEEFRKDCLYHASPHAIGEMLNVLLTYISYLGPIKQWFQIYLHPFG